MTNPEKETVLGSPHPEIVHHIANQIEGLTPEQVHAVLATWNNVREGAPVGTVCRDPETGAVGHRVDNDGVHIWRVSLPDGEIYNDMQPSLGWPAIYEPEG
jgi:hypothetical protein